MLFSGKNRLFGSYALENRKSYQDLCSTPNKASLGWKLHRNTISTWYSSKQKVHSTSGCFYSIRGKLMELLRMLILNNLWCCLLSIELLVGFLEIITLNSSRKACFFILKLYHLKLSEKLSCDHYNLTSLFKLFYLHIHIYIVRDNKEERDL